MLVSPAFPRSTHQGVRPNDADDTIIVGRPDVLLRLDPAETIALAESRSFDPRVLYPFRDGAPAGVLRVKRPLIDARGREIPPGEYELVYRVQPALKEHVDTTEFRDFLLLRREDAKSGEHPLVLAMVPATGEVGSGPRFLEGDPLVIEFDLGRHRVALAFSY